MALRRSDSAGRTAVLLMTKLLSASSVIHDKTRIRIRKNIHFSSDKIYNNKNKSTW